MNLEPTETRKESQNCTNRVNSIAIGSAVSPSKDKNCYKCYQCNNKGGKTLYPNICLIEKITIKMLCNHSQTIVCQSIERSAQVTNNSTKTTIRSRLRPC